MTTTTLAAEFIAACAEIENPKKNSTNPAFKSKYANLEEMLRVIKPVFAAHGMAVIQAPVSDENGVGVHTTVMGHGEVLDFGSFTVPLAKRDAQGAGGAITYCRRYALAAVAALAQEDDDGVIASKPPKLASEATITTLRELKDAAGKTDDEYATALEYFGVTVDTELTEESAKRLIGKLKTLVAA